MNILSRENSTVLRGVAILAIMLHNFLHISDFGFSVENEMSFSKDLSQAFYSTLFSGNCNYVAELFSFLGWTGVPVFVFLTGYGLMKKYAEIPNRWQFVKRNYLKLFWLLLPGLLVFLFFDVLKGSYLSMIRRLTYLTMLQNLDYPDLSVNPGVYWYFSLTFQLYLFFVLARKWMNSALWLLVLSILSLVGLWLLETFNCTHAFSIFRHCFTGWFPIFALGVFYAQQNKEIRVEKFPVSVDIAIAAILFAFMLLMNCNFEIWLLLPVVALFFFFVIGKLILRSGTFLTNCFSWMGKYSACIFVCHPIARALVLRLYPKLHHIGLVTILYFILVVILAFYYNKAYQLFLKRFTR